MRIVVVSNSQGADLGVRPGSEYPRLLRRDLEPEHEVEVHAVSGWTIRDVNVALPGFLALGPDLIVVQIGIVECSRRILSRWEKRILYRIPGGRVASKFLHDHRAAVIRLRSRFGITTRDFTLAEFRTEVAALAEQIATAGVELLLLEIPHFPREHERRYYPSSGEDISAFNGVLRAYGAVPLLPVEGTLLSIWQPGTVHLTEAGHRMAADALRQRLERPARITL